MSNTDKETMWPEGLLGKGKTTGQKFSIVLFIVGLCTALGFFYGACSIIG